MKKQEMKKIAQEAFNAYLEIEENKEEIFIKEDTFEIFRENGYDIYTTGESYIYEGILKTVSGNNTIIAVNRESAKISNQL